MTGAELLSASTHTYAAMGCCIKKTGCGALGCGLVVQHSMLRVDQDALISSFRACTEMHIHVLCSQCVTLVVTCYLDKIMPAHQNRLWQPCKTYRLPGNNSPVSSRGVVTHATGVHALVSAAGTSSTPHQHGRLCGGAAVRHGHLHSPLFYPKRTGL
jgi:hypothetical protein